ncbi:MAG: D-aminoacyl-tRNA deacylase [Methylophaga sp.]|jgi:D-aminoacyl-tRNA deacylase
MIALLQRVSQADVHVDKRQVAEIQQGLLVFIGVERSDTEADADRLLERLLGYRVFSDDNGKMNLSLKDIHGGLLLVPQFTLPADTRKGMRPSFTPAAPPEQGRALFDYLVSQARNRHPETANGLFGADMQVSLTNDGPVTFWLQTH